MMPSGDGINLITHIKELSNTPVIMLTAMGEDNNKIQGLKEGSDDYLSKPFEPEELYLRIENLLKLYENINQSDVGITRLRQKIEKTPKQPQYIKTIRGKGYMLICKEI